MVQITIFEKSDCLYCKRVLALIKLFTSAIAKQVLEANEDIVQQVLSKDKELQISDKLAQFTKLQDLMFKFKRVDIKEDAALAALCIRLTGTFTVPQVFFDEIYIGDASKFNCCVKDTDVTLSSVANVSQAEGQSSGSNAAYNVDPEKVRNKCPRFYDQLLELGRTTLGKVVKGEDANLNFPPTPAARMVKVTNDLAFSSQPTIKQLENLKSFGFNTVINISKPNSQAYNTKERELLKEAGVGYFEIPCHTMSKNSIGNVLQIWNELINENRLENPVLIHDDSGQRAGIILLLHVAQLMVRNSVNAAQKKREIVESNPVTKDTFLSWAQDLGVNAEPCLSFLEELLENIFRYEVFGNENDLNSTNILIEQQPVVSYSEPISSCLEH